MGNAAARPIVEDLLARSAQDAQWRSELAVVQLLALEAIDQNDASRFPRYAAIVEKARLADPASGLWSALAARDAARVGLADKAKSYAEEALTHPVDDATRTLLEKYVAGTASAPSTATPSGSASGQ